MNLHAPSYKDNLHTIAWHKTMVERTKILREIVFVSVILAISLLLICELLALT